MGGRTVTIATQVGGKNVVRQASNGGSSTLRPVFTATHVEDRTLLSRMLNQFIRWVEAETAPAQSNPMNGAVILRNIALGANTTTQIPHLLGRDPTGWMVVRAQTAPFYGYEVALASGLDRTRYLAIKSVNTGTYDLAVF